MDEGHTYHMCGFLLSMGSGLGMSKRGTNKNHASMVRVKEAPGPFDKEEKVVGGRYV